MAHPKLDLIDEQISKESSLVSLDTPFNKSDKLTDLGLSSLDILSLGIEIEILYDISIPDEEVEEWKTVQDVYNSVIKYL